MQKTTKEKLILFQKQEKKIVSQLLLIWRGGGAVLYYVGGEPSENEEISKWKKKHEEVVRLGGLCVIGTERHESRRIDNQLRGRSGRQGDPGETIFFVSLEDDLM